MLAKLLKVYMVNFDRNNIFFKFCTRFHILSWKFNFYLFSNIDFMHYIKYQYHFKNCMLLKSFNLNNRPTDLDSHQSTIAWHVRVSCLEGFHLKLHFGVSNLHSIALWLLPPLLLFIIYLMSANIMVGGGGGGQV